MRRRRLFGIETEYAVTALDQSGAVIPRHRLNDSLLRAAARSVPSLKGMFDAGLFLGNGSRLYCDAGDHPELAGPECLNPWDAIRYARAGDRLLFRLADDVRRRCPSIAHVRVFAGNVDYSGTLSTWGAHESYCHRADPRVLHRRLLPHLVSRVIYSGSGGFNPFSSGLEFTLSPRAHHLDHVISDASTHDRGIIHTRDEPLAGRGYRRQHLICGEHLRSDLAAWLTLGATALVVAMIEGGVACGDDVELALSRRRAVDSAPQSDTAAPRGRDSFRWHDSGPDGRDHVDLVQRLRRHREQRRPGDDDRIRYGERRGGRRRPDRCDRHHRVAHHDPVLGAVSRAACEPCTVWSCGLPARRHDVLFREGVRGRQRPRVERGGRRPQDGRVARARTELRHLVHRRGGGGGHDRFPEPAARWHAAAPGGRRRGRDERGSNVWLSVESGARLDLLPAARRRARAPAAHTGGTRRTRDPGVLLLELLQPDRHQGLRRAGERLGKATDAVSRYELELD